MEDEKKKNNKRNKKKKNKQRITPEADEDFNGHIGDCFHDDNAELDLDTHQPNGALALDLLKELRKENESHVQTEATLQEKIKHLQDENESYIQKEATLEETIKQLRNEFDSHLKKEVSLEETILKLQHRNDTHLQKEASLEETIQQLQFENESHMQKVASLEENNNQLLEEKTALDLKAANLEENIKQLEKEKESSILTENSTKEAISSLNRDITRLKMQVVELEESRSKLLQENQQLTENVSGLQLYIQNLERNMTSGPSSDELKKQASGDEDLNSQIEAAIALVDKLIMENAELVEKVNELYVKLNRQSMAAGHSTGIESVPMAKVAETASVSNSVALSVENGSMLAPKMDAVEAAPVYNGKIDGENVDGQHVAPLPIFIEAEDSGEIVQIPLDDTDVRDLESQATDGEENFVPISDAPLIGAPFRLISFAAKYVSGADLVNN
ncbi:protein hook homolog isoform X3 [Durio zibethinus]|uniref:Protein hook homolog isoform X3 n=1 Tax=Durio zibethinus TaxID=66656 RepID=A0A6P5Y299_DURZI|nr:protein hook homolog isoform X3 [Durio zibethinus]